MVSLPGISGLHGLNSCKLSINKSSFNATRGFKDGLRTIFFGASGKKIPGGGFVSSSLDNSSSQKTTKYSEKARGKKAEISDCRHDPQESSSRGIKRKASDTNLKDSFNAKDFSVFSDRLYKDVTQISGSRVEDIFNKNKSHLALVRSITLGDLGINSNSREGKLIANFAENYKGDVPAVKQFCSAVLNPANPYYSNIVIYSIVEDIKTTSSAKGRKELDAIHERTK